MERQKVKSTLIAEVGYDEAQKLLEIQFTAKPNQSAGAIYQYKNFSADDWSRFKTSKSIGEHFTEWIRGRFEYAQVSKGTPKEPTGEAAQHGQA